MPFSFIRTAGGNIQYRSGGSGFVFNFAPRPPRPENTVKPALVLDTGNAGKVGSTYDIVPGTWTNSPTLSRVLYRNDQIISGTEGATSYTLTGDDDVSDIYIREQAVVSGWAPLFVDSDPVFVTYNAPLASGSIANVSAVQGSAIVTRDVTGNFSGSNLVYSVTGPAEVSQTDGIVSVSTNNLQSAATVVVTATNSGGSASRSFTVTITAGTPPPTGPDPIETSELEITFEVDPSGGTVPTGAATWMFKVLSGPALSATRLWWSGKLADPSFAPGAGFHPTIPHPVTAEKWIARAANTANLSSPLIRDWLWINRGDSYDKIGQNVVNQFIYTTDALSIPPESATWSAFSEVFTTLCEVEGVTPPPPPPPPTGLKSRRMPLRLVPEKAVGMKPGHGIQVWHDMAFALSDPDYIYGMQDTGGIWRSEDGGNTWYLPHRIGLASFQGLGVCVDPNNPLHVLANMGGSYPNTKLTQGIYRSIDGAMSFGPRIVAAVAGARRATHRSMAFAPGSSLINGRTSKIFIIALGSPFDDVPRNHPVRTSIDAGATWQSAGTWNQTTWGLIHYMIGDESNDNVFWVGTTKGLVKITNAFSGSPDYSLINSGGLITGSLESLPYVSSDGQTIIVAFDGKGIYKSTNGGSAWSRVGTHSSFSRVSFNPYDPSRMISMGTQTSTVRTPYWSKNGGTSFTVVNLNDVERRFPDQPIPWMIGNFNMVAWHDSNPDRAYMHGIQTANPHSANNYRTDDLIHWRPRQEGFSGENIANKGVCSPNVWSNDRNVFVTCYLDAGPRVTTDGGQSFLENNIKLTSITPSLSDRTTFGVAIHPTKHNIVFAAVEANSPRLLRSTAGGTGSWTEIPGVLVNDGHIIFCDPQDDSVWFAGRKKSTNDGASFPTTMAGLPTDATVIDRSHTGHAMWAQDLGGSRKNFYRSIDRGNSWQLVLTTSYDTAIMNEEGGVANKWGCNKCHPVNQNYFFTKSPLGGHYIRRWDVSSGSGPTSRSSVDLNIFGGSNSPGSNHTNLFAVKHIQIDPRFPNIMYILTINAGGPRMYRTQNAGATAWEELGGDVCPITCNLNGLYSVSPITGDVPFGGSNGAFILGAPYEQTDPLPLISTIGNHNYLVPMPT
jgi:hypothetical protein